MKKMTLALLLVLAFANIYAQRKSSSPKKEVVIEPGSWQLQEYLPMLKGKRVGVFANPTAIVGPAQTLIVDTLIKSGVKITKIFGPEHGFRGTADAGAKVDSYVDEKTGIPVVSLYGKKTKPTAEDLADVDVMLFDLQDVGVRFYTYISSMQDFLESAIINNRPLIILDRPNPNGFYVDGPVLDTQYKSHVGMQPIPVVYGMTIGEYAQMLLSEQMLIKEANDKYQTISASRYKAGSTFFQLTVIRCKNYTHKSLYKLPVNPSPNLKDMASIYLYPSTCFFEGTCLSEGRGTEHPFAIFGHPTLPKNMFSFTPVSVPGATAPKLKDQVCYGWNLFGSDEEILKKVDNKIQIKYLVDAYKLFPGKDSFFLKPKSGKMAASFIAKLYGNTDIIQQLADGKSEAEIRASWEPKLSAFKKIRKKYLLYTDFE